MGNFVVFGSVEGAGRLNGRWHPLLVDVPPRIADLLDD